MKKLYTEEGSHSSIINIYDRRTKWLYNISLYNIATRPIMQLYWTIKQHII